MASRQKPLDQCKTPAWRVLKERKRRANDPVYRQYLADKNKEWYRANMERHKQVAADSYYNRKSARIMAEIEELRQKKTGT